jgi:RNA polymerase sigma factor (sigma-70 family)
MQATQALRSLTDPPERVAGLEGLFRQHHDLVFRTAYRITGSVVDAEDVLQTVFLRLLKSKAGFDLSPNPALYLHRAAINGSLDLVRSPAKSKSVSMEALPPDSTRGGGLDPEQEHAEGEMRRQVRQSIARLGPKAAEVVVLKYFEGYQNGEIAEMIGTSKMVVAVMLHRARRRLRKDIAEFLGGTE